MSKSLISPHGQNNLIRTLRLADREAIEPYLTPVALPAHMVLDEPGMLIRDIRFPVMGVGTVIASGPGNRRIEAGVFGREGVSGMAVVLGGDRVPSRTVMQIGGVARTIEADRLRDLMEARPSMRTHLLRFVQAMVVQAGQTVVSTGHASLEQRLARWLLMCHDRMPGNEVILTHDTLGLMLGVRRAGVTDATHLLEGQSLIRAERGRITILDRDGLERDAAGYYGGSEAEYERLFGQVGQAVGVA